MSQYESGPIEKRWQKMWREDAVYRFDPESDAPVYSIDNPPRYTSGPLHLGHATGYSLIDFAARYHRMRGYNVFLPLCFDVNGTPIEVKVEKKHNITKLDLPRKEYRRLCSEFANSFIDEMTTHFEMLGASMDPSIYYQTDAPYYRRITQLSFIKLFNMGMVYKGNFPINWCPRCMTALADAEVNHKDNTTKLNYIRFTTEDNETVMIATTRPELLCTCQAVAVHPGDATKSHLVGKKLITPIYRKKVNVIADEKVDPAYGTGNVMICTVGDKDDLEWVMKYKLPMEKGIDEFGNMTELSGKYNGMKVSDARAAIIEDLRSANVLEKQEDVPQNVSVCWRCSTPIEFLQMPQWFLKTLDFKEQVLKKADEIDWYPEFMKIRLQDWVNSLEWDWVLSRQRIFATPVPVWECENCDHTIVATEEQCYVDPTEDEPPVHECPKCGGKLIGSTDVFDTWMDSSGSALYNTFWERDEKLFKKLFPMSMRPQSHDIIRTWAFYTILRTNQITGSIPWKDIMIHGFIMAPDGTPMHSSIGNVIDPIPILEEYGADALRYYACTCALGMDHAFREKDVIRGRKLCNKIFNMGKFVGRMLSSKPEMPKTMRLSDRWILSRFSSVVKEATECYDSYQFDKAMRIIEDFVWHEFADHYIEMVKSRDDDAAKFSLYTVMLGSIKMLAPFLPHVTEEVYQEFFVQHENVRSIHLAAWPEPVLEDAVAESSGGMLTDVIASVRGWKSDRKMPLNAEIEEIEIIGKTTAVLEDGKEDIRDTMKAKTVNIMPSADLKEDVVAVKPIHSKLGPAFKGLAKSIVSELSKMDPKDVAGSLKDGFKMTVDGEDIVLTSEYVEVENRLLLDGKEVETIQLGDVLIAIRP